jgi:glutaryl-CoA dehydrogenase
LTDEHKLVRDSARAWVKREVSPIIEEYSKAEFPKQILKGLAIWFWSYISEIWWRWIRPNLLRINYAEIERGDSGYVLLLRFNRL